MCPQISEAVDRIVAPPRGLISMFAVVKLALCTYGAIKFSRESPYTLIVVFVLLVPPQDGPNLSKVLRFLEFETDAVSRAEGRLLLICAHAQVIRSACLLPEAYRNGDSSVLFILVFRTAFGMYHITLGVKLYISH